MAASMQSEAILAASVGLFNNHSQTSSSNVAALEVEDVDTPPTFHEEESDEYDEPPRFHEEVESNQSRAM